MLQGTLLAGLHEVVHGFTTRVGPRAEVLDLGSQARPEHWAWVAGELGLPEAPIARVHQVHGARVLRVGAGPLPQGEQADAIVTSERGILLAVRVADCVPVLIYGEAGVAAVHAGWRGLAAGVIPAALAELGPAHHAVVGPCICQEHYEVGEEVVAGIVASGLEEGRFTRRDLGPRPHVDLAGAARAQLQAAGVDRVEVLGFCTWEDDRLSSYRRQGAASIRTAGVIGLRP